jgi:hypothetical protein
MNHRILNVLIVGLFLITPTMLLAQGKPQADTRETASDITYVEGEVFFQNFERAEADMAIKQGDELFTEQGRVEVYLGRGNWLRLDQHTRVVFTSLQRESIKLSVGQGSIYLHLENKVVEVRTPQENFYPERGIYRLDVEKNKAEIYENPRIVDRFDSWSSSRDEELSYPEDEPYYDRWWYSYGWRPYLYGNWWWSPYWYWPYGYAGWDPMWDYYPYYYYRYPYYYGRRTIRKGELRRPTFGRYYSSRFLSRSFSRDLSRFSSSRPFLRQGLISPRSFSKSFSIFRSSSIRSGTRKK